MSGIRYSASWAVPNELAVYLNGDVIVAIAAPNARPSAPYDHVIVSGDVFAEFKRSCMDRGIVGGDGA